MGRMEIGLKRQWPVKASRVASAGLLALSSLWMSPAWGRDFRTPVDVGLANAFDVIDDLVHDGGQWLAVSQQFIDGDQEITTARSSDGLTWSSWEILNANASSDAEDDAAPAVATDGVGTYVAVWETHGSATSPFGLDTDLLVTRSTDGGVTWGPVAALNNDASTDTKDDFQPQIAADGSSYVVIWRSRDRIYTARSTDAGVSWSSPAVLQTSRFALSPTIETDGGGTWVVAWVRWILNSLGGHDRFLDVSRSTDAGATWSTPLSVVKHDPELPRIATDAGGTWIIAWEDQDMTPGAPFTDRDVFATRSTDDGVSWSPPTAVGASAVSDQRPDIGFGFGVWLTLWRTTGSFIDRKVASISLDGGATWEAGVEVDIDGLWPRVETDGAGLWIAYGASSGIHLGSACGDTAVLLLEACDDGNLTPGDGCEPTCTNTGCGDGVVDAGEQCDDGNIDPGDCCAPSCLFEPLGSPCDDENLCTHTDGCVNEVCVGDATPRLDCRTALRGRVAIRDDANPARKRLRWIWNRGEQTASSDFGHPPWETSAGYSLCVYDASASSQPLVQTFTPPGGMTCGTTGTTECWVQLNANANRRRTFQYYDRPASRDGVQRIRLRPGDAGKSRVSLVAKGDQLVLPSLPLTPPVTVQLHNDLGECWGSTYSDSLRNQEGLFRSRSD